MSIEQLQTSADTWEDPSLKQEQVTSTAASHKPQEQEQLVHRTAPNLERDKKEDNALKQEQVASTAADVFTQTAETRTSCP